MRLGTAHDPVQFLPEVRGAAGLPHRFHAAPHCQHIGVVIERGEAFQPRGNRFRVVVEERHDIRGGESHSGVPGSGKAPGTGILHDRDVPDRLDEALVQVRVVVDHDQDLLRAVRLRLDGANDVEEQVPARHGVTADHHGNRRRFSDLGHSRSLPCQRARSAGRWVSGGIGRSDTCT